MKAQFVTSGVYHDFYLCPECENEMPVMVGQEDVQCEDCGKKWILNYDASFNEGMWRDLTTIREKP